MARGEELLERANFNWTYNAGAWTWLFLSWIPIAFALVFWFESFGTRPMPPNQLNLFASIAGIAGFLGFFVWISHMIHVWTTEIVVTTYRFVYKKGWLNVSTQEVSLNKIEEINLTQSFIGRLLGYGTLILRGTGVGVIELPEMDNPVRLRRTIENAKADLRKDTRDERLGNSD
ncbi:MAG: PH domain-containing protein [Pseudomonadota bacterium]